jgi:transposase
MMTVAITRMELGAGDLRREAARCHDANAARRLLALALALEGHPRAAAARHAGMDRQTLRDWVQRYNAEGLAGRCNRRPPGRKPRLTPEQATALEQVVEQVVEQGPDPARDGVVRWRRVDLQALIKARFAVDLHERSVGKVLRRLGFARLSVRPKHPASEPEVQEAFKKGSPTGCARPSGFARSPGGMSAEPTGPSVPAASRSRSGRRGWLNAARSTASASRAP